LAGRADEGAFWEVGSTVRGNDWNDEVMAVVEGGKGRQKRVGSVGVSIALSAVELCAELGCPSGSGSWRENVVLGLAFGGCPKMSR